MSSSIIKNASADAPPVSSSSQTSAIPESNLNEIPSELRVKIFTLVLSKPWNGEIPDLIKAFRSDKKLYSEAIAVFTKLQKFEITQGDTSIIKSMSFTAALTIKNLEFHVTSQLGMSHTNKRFMLSREVMFVYDLRSHLREFTLNLTKGWKPYLAILASPLGYSASFARFVIRNSKSLKKFAIIFKMEEQTRATGVLLNKFIEEMNEALGIYAKLSIVQPYPLSNNEVTNILLELSMQALLHVSQLGATTLLGGTSSIMPVEAVVPGEGPYRTETWFWEAKKGKVLSEVA